MGAGARISLLADSPTERLTPLAGARGKATMSALAIQKPSAIVAVSVRRPYSRRTRSKTGAEERCIKLRGLGVWARSATHPVTLVWLDVSLPTARAPLH